MNSIPRFSITRPRVAGMVAVVLLGLLCIDAGVAQEVQDRWRVHTSMREVVDVSAAGDEIWAATSGGAFRYAPASGEIQAFTASNGLHGVAISALAYDPVRQVVWIGYRDGVLDRLDPETGAVRSYRDIARAERFTTREIRRFFLHGDSLLIATSFGVVVFDPVRGEVRDTYSRLGSLASATPVNDVLIAPTPAGVPGIWLATAAGVAHAPLGAPNLQDPQAWTVETSGLPALEVLALAWFRDRVYAGTVQGIAVRSAEGTYANTGITTYAVSDFAETPGRLLAVEQFTIIAVEPTGEMRRMEVPGYGSPTSVLGGPDGVWMGDRQGGLVGVTVPSPPATQVVVRREGVSPEGPFHNAFADLMVDSQGVLWAVSNEGLGFYRLGTDEQWTDYVAARVPELAGRGGFDRIYVDGRDHAWVGSAGSALIQVVPEGTLQFFNQTNSTLRAPKGESNANFILIGGIASDRQGNVWVTNRAAPEPLHVRTPDGEWTALSGFQCSGLSLTGVTFDRIVIDSFGQKWIVVLSEANLRQRLGLLVLDTRNTPTDTRDDVCRFFGTKGSGGQGLPGIDVTTVVEDRDGTIWIGTTEGLAFVINNGVVAHDASGVPVWPQLADRTLGTFLFYGARINDLVVDPANRLWVATDQGVHLVQQLVGGYEVVQSFTTENAPLLSNNVLAVAVRPQSGEVFFATEQGMVSYIGDAVAPVEQAGSLLVYPNPVRIEDGSEPDIFIDGLVETTELRILAPHGAVVASMSTRGGRIRWNGRDRSGQLVPSGVYLVVAVGQNGEGAAYGKVAVIR